MNTCQRVIEIIQPKDQYKTTFSQKLGTKLQKFPIKSLNALVTQMNKYLVKDNLKEDLRAKLEALLELIEEEIETR